MRRVAAACLALVVTACGGAGSTGPARQVRFSTEDGVRLTGDLRGTGDTAVVLAHMFPSDRTSWEDFSVELTGEGYMTLAFDFRGYGDSGGRKEISELWRDVLAAVEEARARGAGRVVVVGASMGGTAALVAASRAELDGLITLSAPSTFMGLEATPEVVGAVDEPKLFLAAEGDGTAAQTAQAFYTEAPGAKRVEILIGDEHGSDMLETGQAEVARRLIFEFLSGIGAPAGAS